MYHILKAEDESGKRENLGREPWIMKFSHCHLPNLLEIVCFRLFASAGTGPRQRDDHS
jgi:hypothetical protein